jgi:hypothetical protein
VLVACYRPVLDNSTQGKYRSWAKTNRFESKLPGDIKAWKVASEKVNQTLKSHFVEAAVAERVVKYSDKVFREAAIEWLIATDQVRCDLPRM